MQHTRLRNNALVEDLLVGQLMSDAKPASQTRPAGAQPRSATAVPSACASQPSPAAQSCSCQLSELLQLLLYHQHPPFHTLPDLRNPPSGLRRSVLRGRCRCGLQVCRGLCAGGTLPGCERAGDLLRARVVLASTSPSAA
jgi:hypothetical protein